MRYLTAAVFAVISAGAAQAVTLDLTYTIQTEVTDVDYFDHFAGTEIATPYPGPKIGEIVEIVWSHVVDTDLLGQYVPNDRGGYDQVDFFGVESGAISYEGMPNGDETLRLWLSPHRPGWMRELVLTDGPASGLNWVEISYDIASWEVEGLPEIAPVPLPASLPLLAVGVGAFAAIRRKQRRVRA